jgi:rhodanese-related sulfurtransferase
MMRTTIIAVLAVVTVAISSVALWASDEKAEQFPNITISDLKEAMAAKAVTLLDANGTDSFKDGHIPGAIDFTASADDIAKVLPSDKNALIVAYCGGPQCMAYKSAAAKAKELGYTNIKHLTAGISGWKDAGEKVEKAS